MTRDELIVELNKIKGVEAYENEYGTTMILLNDNLHIEYVHKNDSITCEYFAVLLAENRTCAQVLTIVKALTEKE